MERLKFTEDCRPKPDDIIMCCTNEGHIYCGVVTYPSYMDVKYARDIDKETRSISISMFVNEMETNVKVDTLEIRWWHLLPLTRTELWTGKAF